MTFRRAIVVVMVASGLVAALGTWIAGDHADALALLAAMVLVLVLFACWNDL